MAFRVDSQLLYETNTMLRHRVHIVCYGSFEKYFEDKKFDRTEKSLEQYSKELVEELFDEHRQQLIDELTMVLFNNLPKLAAEKGNKNHDE